jgi:hypothetical protein
MYKRIPPICGSSLEHLWFKRYHRPPDITTLCVFVSVFFPNKHTPKHTPNNIKMESPLCQVAWECGNGAIANQGREQLPCLFCRAVNPCRNAILAGSSPAATAQTVQVMCTKQHDIIWAASEARIAVVPCPVPVVDRALFAERLRGTLIEIVGAETSKNGRERHAHKVCGAQLTPGSNVCFRRETYISPTTGNEEDCLVAYVVSNGVMPCKVGYLPRHLAIRRADNYDGMYACVVEVYLP